MVVRSTTEDKLYRSSREADLYLGGELEAFVEQQNPICGEI